MVYYLIKKIYVRAQNHVFELLVTSQIGLIGVNNGDILFPTLFSVFISDPVHEINNLYVGIEQVNCILSMLLYADNICSDSEIYNVC